MQFNKSIAIPIIGQILFLISLITLSHYFIQTHSLRNAIVTENRNKAEHIYTIIQTIVKKEEEKLLTLSKTLKELECLVDSIVYSLQFQEPFGPSEEMLDKYYQELKVDLLEVVDTRGQVLYRAHEPGKKGDFADYWGVVEALDGQDMLVSSNSKDGWGIRAIVPIMNDNKKVFGILMVGTRINNDFAREISRYTGAEISFGSLQGLFATSLPADRRSEVDFSKLLTSRTETRQIYTDLLPNGNIILYAPFQVVDEFFGFVAEVDGSQGRLLLESSKSQLIRLLAVTLFIVLAIGIGLTVFLIRPLKELTKRATLAVSDISGTQSFKPEGNEINQLVQAFEFMIERVMSYLKDRKKAEKDLIEEKEKLTITLGSIDDAVITTDVQGKIELLNYAAEKLTGWTLEEAFGLPLADVYTTFAKEKNISQTSPIEDILQGKRTPHKLNEKVLQARDGTDHDILESGAPIRDSLENIFGVVLVFRDITELKKLQEDRVKSKKLESLGVLAGGIAHDFNNILTAIVGNSSLVATQISSESKAYECLTEIEKAVSRAKGLTRKLLTFSKGGAPIRKIADSSALIVDSAGFILSGSGTKCAFSLPDDLWAIDVDKGQISQVIQNLCLNAAHAMQNSGTIQVKAENIFVSENDELSFLPGKYLKISFRDHGIGISPENLPLIFDPYFTTKEEGGGGLGLATVHSIVKSHEGYIDVISKLGKGTTFIIYLPASLEKVEAEPIDDADQLIPGKGKILIMDDEEMLRTIVIQMLAYLGYEAEAVKDGEEALELYEKRKQEGHPFDLVIMDLTIPGGMGGEETIRIMREKYPDIKAIVASGYSNDPIMANYKKYGFTGMMKKPFDVIFMSKVISSVLS